MTKREKRLQKIRQNPRNVSYNDYTSVLDDYGYTIKSSKTGSHRKATRIDEDRTWTLTFVEPHGNNKYMHHKDVSRLLKQIDEIEEEGEEDE